MQSINLKDTLKYIKENSEKFSSVNLKAYLLNLHYVIIENKEKTINQNLFFFLIDEALILKPNNFNSSWLQIEEAPDSIDINITSLTKEEALKFTLEVIVFQISELHKMKEKQLENKYKYFGIESETGHYWYNFDPLSILGCGINCLIDNKNSNFPLNWAFIGFILELGRIYE